MSKLKFPFYALGIGISYLYFGVLQERITRSTYEPGHERFTCTQSLVLVQCLINTIFARLILAFIIPQGRDMTKWHFYPMCSFTYLTAMVSSNMALRHVSYPTQVVAKSCKPIPIMILGMLLGNKHYPIKKYVFVSTIVMGVALFMFKDSASSNKKLSTAQDQSDGSSLLGSGELLLLLSLTMDGLTGAVQERMKAAHRTKSVHMMYNMNLWSTGLLAIITFYTGEIWEFTSFIERHPNLLVDLSLFSALSAIGQLFIFLTVTEFGPLTCSILTTTRKFFTVLISVFLFGNSLTNRQWIGTSLVFTGLALDSFSK